MIKKNDIGLILGIAGKKGAGKNLAGRFLEEMLREEFPNDEVRQLAFADPIKDMLETLMDRPIRLTPNKESDDSGFDGVPLRVLMQTLGTEWGRNCINEDIWVNHLIRRIDKEVASNVGKRTHFIITDVRFQNEYKRIRGLKNGYIVSIECNSYSAVRDPHASEAGMTLTDDDFIVYNAQKGIEPFKDSLSAVLDEIIEELQSHNTAQGKKTMSPYDIRFSVNEYGYCQDGDILGKGIYLHFGDIRVMVAETLEEFEQVAKQISGMIPEIRENY